MMILVLLLMKYTKSIRTMNEVIQVDFKKVNGPENDMVKQIKDVIYSFAGQVTVASAFGVLEIVKHDLDRDLLP